MTHYPNVTLLITHFNRSQSLTHGLQAFHDLDISFADIVISDDGSASAHLDRLKKLQTEYAFRLLTTPVNRGLGHNLNKGQDAVGTPYTLYVQEDFCPTSQFPGRFQDALALMEKRPDVDLIRFFTQHIHPRLRPVQNGYLEMVFRLLTPGFYKFFCYSDTPHLRRRSFFRQFGRYAEGIPAVKGEKAMMMSFLQAHGKCLVCDKSDIFVHENTDHEPSTQDYSAFQTIRRRLPAVVFELLWTAKLTAEFLFKRYRH